MLKAHMEAKERALLAISQIPTHSGHPLHKGTPREAFIREFLSTHLPESVAIGTGEIIDSKSRPGESRNQYDIVIYKKNYPKLDFGGGISGFLIESVIATIEVKSTLTEPELKKAILAARNAKRLEPSVTTSFSSGYIPPSVLNYVISYAGPATMDTVYGWIPKSHSELGLNIANLPLDINERVRVVAPSIDAVFVLGTGFAYFDNTPNSFANDEVRKANPELKWVFCNTETGSLLMFFLLLQAATANIEAKWLNAVAYLETFRVPGVKFGTA